jgi:hypothetical protein
MYNEDLDRTPPASWKRFREQIAGARAALILTPEYKTRTILTKFMAAFERWITRVGGETVAADLAFG